MPGDLPFPVVASRISVIMPSETIDEKYRSTVFLLDSGGQYPDGTTDVTRTVWIAGSEPGSTVQPAGTAIGKTASPAASTRRCRPTLTRIWRR